MSTLITVQGKIDCIRHNWKTVCADDQDFRKGNERGEAAMCLKTAEKHCRIHKMPKEGLHPATLA